MSRNCRFCRYSRLSRWSAHFRCEHPVTKKVPSGAGLLAAFSPTLISYEVRAAGKAIGLQANVNGMRRGFFNWPDDVDPAWLIRCNGFKVI